MPRINRDNEHFDAQRLRRDILTVHAVSHYSMNYSPPGLVTGKQGEQVTHFFIAPYKQTDFIQCYVDM